MEKLIVSRQRELSQKEKSIAKIFFQIKRHIEKNSKNVGLPLIDCSTKGIPSVRYLAAIDTRIKSAISCSVFNAGDQYPWSDWTWFDSADKFDDVAHGISLYVPLLKMYISAMLTA